MAELLPNGSWVCPPPCERLNCARRMACHGCGQPLAIEHQSGGGAVRAHFQRRLRVAETTCGQAPVLGLTQEEVAHLDEVITHAHGLRSLYSPEAAQLLVVAAVRLSAVTDWVRYCAALRKRQHVAQLKLEMIEVLSCLRACAHSEEGGFTPNGRFVATHILEQYLDWLDTSDARSLVEIEQARYNLVDVAADLVAAMHRGDDVLLATE